MSTIKASDIKYVDLHDNEILYERLKCVDCNFIPLNPKMCVDANHLYCDYHYNGLYCGHCDNPIDDCPKIIKDIMDIQKVYCLYKDNGCEEIMVRSKLKEHIENCPYRNTDVLIAKLKEEINNKNQIISTKEQIIDKLKSDICDFEVNIISLKEKIINKDFELEILKSQLDDFEELKVFVNELKTENNELHEALDDRMAGNIKDLTLLTNKNTELNLLITNKDTEIDNLKKENIKLHVDINNYKSQIDKQKEEIDSLSLITKLFTKESPYHKISSVVKQ